MSISKETGVPKGALLIGCCLFIFLFAWAMDVTEHDEPGNGLEPSEETVYLSDSFQVYNFSAELWGDTQFTYCRSLNESDIDVLRNGGSYYIILTKEDLPDHLIHAAQSN